MKKGIRAMSTKSEAEWQAEEDMRTLMRAEEIRKDPKRLKAAKDAAKKKLEEMKAVTGVVEAA